MVPNIGARCTGIRAVERGMKAPRIPGRGIELLCPLICAVAFETVKTQYRATKEN